MQRRRPVMLVILDGFGWREDAADPANPAEERADREYKVAMARFLKDVFSQ